MTKFIAAARRYWLLKLALFLGALAGVYFAGQVGVGETARAYPALRGPIWLVGGLSIATAMIAAYRALVGWLERRDAIELDPGDVAGIGLAGLPMGVFLFSLVMGILAFLPVAHFEQPIALPNFLGLTGGAIAAAVGEEIVFRGVLFRLVERRFGSLAGIAFSALLFGAAHAANPGANLFSAIAIALNSGVLLGVAYMASQSLWLPIWLHFGWNFTEGAIFGTSVSGGHAQPGMIATSLTGPDILTGGAFGPEASIVALGVTLAASLCFLAMSVRGGQWRPYQ